MDPMEPWEPAEAGERTRERRRSFGDSLASFSPVRRLTWRPSLNLSFWAQQAGAASDRELAGFLAETLLAVPADAATLAGLTDAVRDERTSLGMPARSFFDAGPDAEYALRRLAHRTLALPEAQLH